MSTPTHIWDLIVVLTHKEIKVRYKNNILGYFWSIAQPLAFAGVFYVVFDIVMNMGDVHRGEHYMIFLLTVLFPWQWFSNSVTVSPAVFHSNTSIIKKINFPRNIIPLSIVLQDMIHFLLSIPVILLFLFVFGKGPALSWVYGIPLLALAQLMMTYGACLIVSSLNLFFRDLEKLTSILITFLFYFTPVLYSVDRIPLAYRRLARLNPLTPLMICWRNLFLYGRVEAHDLGLSAAYAVAILGVGFWVYGKLSWRFAEVL